MFIRENIDSTVRCTSQICVFVLALSRALLLVGRLITSLPAYLPAGIWTHTTTHMSIYS